MNLNVIFITALHLGSFLINQILKEFCSCLFLMFLNKRVKVSVFLDKFQQQ